MKTKKINILFTSSGRRVSLIEHFKKELKELNNAGKIITCDVKSTSPAAFVSHHHEIVPPVYAKSYISKLKEICIQNEVNLLIPLIDSELCIISKHKKEFEKLGVTILASSLKVNEICFDKSKTTRFFKENNIECPKEYNIEDVLLDENSVFPYLIKPAKGSSSIGVYKINNRKELNFFKDYISQPILQEFLSGNEYTIDVFVDFNGEYLTAVPRLRIETRAGEVSKGLTVKNKLLMNAAKDVINKLPGVIGCITLQCFYTNHGDIKFIEINPRFGGGSPLSIEAGANFPKFIIETLTNTDSSINMDSWNDGLLMLRYDDAIFLNRDKI
ncbi:ATP-grasp domain-containing protein [Peribacillus sp. NPDC046944]|uniref:ATP-grasp domain-containing protein n=1 Tax=unclassified Peribacillus TaxID=2675266 RepID=UPI003D05B02C